MTDTPSARRYQDELRYPDDLEEDEEELASGGQRAVLAVIALIVIALFVGVVWVAYQQGLAQADFDTPPILTDEGGPLREAPANPGGRSFADAPKPIQDRVPADLDAVTVAPPPEVPLVADAAPQAAPDASVDATEPAAQPAPETQPAEPEVAAAPAPEPAAAPDTPAAVLAPAAARAPTSGSHVLQVGSYTSSELAAAAWQTISGRQAEVLGALRPDIKAADLGERGTWYRLRVGPFDSKDEAAGMCAALKARGQDCLIAEP